MACNTVDHKQAAASLPLSKNSRGSGYRDDPDTVSMHTTRSDYEYDDLPELPSYSGSVAADGETVARASHSALLPAGHDQYASIISPKQPRNWAAFKRSDCTQSPSAAVGNETSIRMDEALMHPEHLYEYIETYLRNVPPRPCVRIQGWHWQTVKKEKEKK
ncbi:Hypothetical predicted protein [Lecanosticta acicola]|uniref:Uncharacterized protein n=1 Tax=Lecanosticta acicola TaxID=111012 RepID=A0AAI8W1K4_9PEZI|nr:Hypothetical predicted protein [Lecanosticta acicola]